jgi:alkylresorcinol/alkylpyrone synthase
MLQSTTPLIDDNARSPAPPRLDVEILAVATATPKVRIRQAEAAKSARTISPHLEFLWGLYDNTGIETRYSCEPHDWYLQPRSWGERTRSFQKHAVDLLEEVTRTVGEALGIDIGEIDMIVTNTVTGLAIPSLDAKLLNRLHFSNKVERLPIFGLGCGGGIGGLARAARLAQGMPGAHVLFLTVDLCSLCLRVNDPSPAMFVSGALFGDGAAAVLLHNTNETAAKKRSMPRICAVGEWCWRDTEYIMGWDIKEDGFGVVLSPQLPAFMQMELAPAVHEFVSSHGLRLEEFNGFLFHPGSRKLLETAAEALEIDRPLLAHSWNVLRDFGNMSSATALFVLERALRAGARGPHLLAAFGPGFSAYFIAADL